MAVSDRGRPFLWETPPWRKTAGSYFGFLYSLITKLMYCHTWLMRSVAYQGPWSICEHFNSNMENCMSKYQRVMPWVLAFFAEGGYSFWAHICQKRFLTAIRSHSATIYGTSRSPKAFVPTALLPLFCFLDACFTSHKYKWMIIFIWIESLPVQSLAYWLLMLKGRGEINRGCTEKRQIK